MKAAVFIERLRPLSVREYPDLPPAPGQAVVDLETSGVCGTDVHIWEGAIPFEGPMILGHEMLGRVRALGDGPAFDCLGAPLRPGNRVAVNVIEPCGECALCRSGGAASCLKLASTLTYTRSPEEPPHLHGGWAEANHSPIRYLQGAPEDVPAEVLAAFLCAGPTVVRGLAYAGGVAPGERVVVQGSGPVGLFAALYAKRLGAAHVILIGSGAHPARLPLARDLGADEVHDFRATTEEERKAAVAAATGGIGADLAIECSGAPEAAVEGLHLLRLRGRAVWAGQYSNRGTVAMPPHLITFNALQVFGSAQFTAEDRAEYFRFLRSVPDAWPAIARVVTHRFPVDRASEAVATARSGAAIKAVLTREQGAV
ncbi:MAG TPA: alcohol dehydrogenase catalytic domain-containing protein [Chthonomonadales bacterium]|nr:alcohol dehydrogenase catalytic domain-containing protein [Chthonomonadales bacterium]